MGDEKNDVHHDEYEQARRKEAGLQGADAETEEDTASGGAPEEPDSH